MIKIAQIGTSELSHGNLIFSSLTKQTDIFEVVGYAMPENEREKYPEHIKLFEGYPELTVEEILNNPEIEAVAVETEEPYLTKYALAAAEAGKHIHMEKPGGIELADFEKLVETVKKTGKTFHTGYMYRYNPFVIELLNQIKAGELGEIISVEAQMNCYHPKYAREWLKKFPGGALFFLGCHLIDLILQIQGRPENIIPLSKSTEPGVGEDFGMAAFEYKNGVSFAKVNTNELGGFLRRQLMVTGTKKTVEIRPFEKTIKGSLQITGKTERMSGSWRDAGVYSETEPFDRYDGMMAGFAKAVKEGNSVSPDYELELYKTVLKACGK